MPAAIFYPSEPGGLVGKSANKKRRQQTARPRPGPVSSGKPLPAGVSAEKKSAKQDVTPAKPEKFPAKKVLSPTLIVLITALIGLVAIVAREPGDGGPGIIFVVVSCYGLTLIWDILNKEGSGDGSVSIRNISEIFVNFFQSNKKRALALGLCLAWGAALVLFLLSPSLASAWGSLLPARSRNVAALEVSIITGELAVMAFGGWMWFRRPPKRPSPRFGYRDMGEGLGDLAWTLAMISIAFGAAGSTSNLDWLVVTGVSVPIFINLRRQSYPNPRRAAAGTQRTENQ
jgi:hypothetical protein